MFLFCLFILFFRKKNVNLQQIFGNMFYKEIITPFLGCVEKFADRNAFCIDETMITYRQFAEVVSKIRLALAGQESRNTKVGLVVNSDIETYASIFALWLEGRCYVPLHPSWPLERCEDIIGQVEIDLILDSSEQTSRYQGDSYTVLATKPLEYTTDCLAPKMDVPDEALAYILFTSGSTGKPKGVELCRKNLASFVNAFFDIYTLDEHDRGLQCFELTFDLSIISYLVPLLRGACVYVVPSDGVKYFQIGGMIEEEELTFALMAPSTIKLLRPYFDEIDCSSLRYSLFCGEALHLDVTQEWAACAKNAVIDNVYGPTEDTIWCSTYRYNREGETKAYNGVISIGRPMKNCGMEIFDEALNRCQPGVLGELCLSGDQLTPGYHKNPEKNAEAFFVKDGVRWYRSGDLCYVDEQGDIMYSGRIDHQAKIQGFRVELGEIEYHAKQWLKDKNVVCVAFDNESGITEIAMFVESEEFDSHELFQYMRSKIPAYMIPTKTLFVSAFPLNANGKTDKKQLKKLL